MEPSVILDKLKGFTDGRKGEKSWVTAIVMFFVVLVATFVFAWVANRKSKELARLRHEKNKQKVEKENAAVQIKVEQNKQDQERLEHQVQQAVAEIQKLEDGIDAVEEARRKDQDAINSITSWSDI